MLKNISTLVLKYHCGKLCRNTFVGINIREFSADSHPRPPPPTHIPEYLNMLWILAYGQILIFSKYNKECLFIKP